MLGCLKKTPWCYLWCNERQIDAKTGKLYGTQARTLGRN